MTTKTKPKAAPANRAPVETAGTPAKDPIACRPMVPTCYGFPISRKGLLDWGWAREHLTQSHNYVIVTVRSDGRPHAMGMHGLWFEDAYYFGTDSATRKAKNLAGNPHCILINEKLDELVIVEGVARTVEYSDLPQGLSEASKAKYGWP